MGKVKDEMVARSTKATPKNQSFRKNAGRVIPFFTNLLKTEGFKTTQGKNARLWTGVGLAVLIGAGIYQYYEQSLKDQYSPLVRITVPVLLAVVFGWIIWRIVQFPPFADFLIATEAEMNKVSWTSREELYRATLVVLGTVLFLALYLFGVDTLWSALLQLIGVLKFRSNSLGSS